MFEKLAKTPARSSRQPSAEIHNTILFLTCVKDQGFRLSYGGLAQAARELGEDSSAQFLGQRGSYLVKTLHPSLQPFVCQKGGSYRKGMTWAVETPADLKQRPWLTEAEVPAAVEEWQRSLDAKEAALDADADAKKKRQQEGLDILLEDLPRTS